MFRKIFNTKTNQLESVPAFESEYDGLKIDVMRVSCRAPYGSEWCVIVRTNNSHYSAKITRDSNQDAEELEEEIRVFGKNITLENIRSLDRN